MSPDMFIVLLSKFVVIHESVSCLCVDIFVNDFNKRNLFLFNFLTKEKFFFVFMKHTFSLIFHETEWVI